MIYAMYYVAKFIQAAALVVIAFNFLQSFPELMNMRILMAGIAVFTSGWLLQRVGARS